MYKFVKGIENNHVDSVNKIALLEKKYEIVFPKALKEYYSKFDGNKIFLTKLTVDGYKCEVAKMIPIVSEKMSFEIITENDKMDGLLPLTFYPLARDRGGNYYYWDSKTEEVYLVLSDDYENPFKVAESIKDFFEMMDNGINY